MSGFNDLGRALRDNAAVNAPRGSAIDVDAVAHAARARRRPRQWAVGTLSVVATLGIGGLALQSVTPPTLIAASESADTSTVESSGGTDLLSEPAAPEALGEDDRSAALLACGAAVPEPYSASALTLSVQVSSSAQTADGEFVGVAVLANNNSDPLSISTRATAIGALTQSGSVVGGGLGASDATTTVDLAAGERYELPLRISTRGCDGELLLAGEYSVIVMVDVTVLTTGESFVLVATPKTVSVD